MKAQDLEKTKELLLHDAQKKVDDFVTFENWAQQRALTIGGFYLATSTALAAGSFSVAERVDVFASALFGSGIAGALAFYIGSLVCFWAAYPRNITTSGNMPEWWKWQIRNRKTHREAIEDYVDDLEQKILANVELAKRTRRLFRWGAAIGLSAPIVSASIWLSMTCNFGQ